MEIFIVIVASLLFLLFIAVAIYVINDLDEIKGRLADVEQKSTADILKTKVDFNNELNKLELRLSSEINKKENKWDASAEYDEDWDEY